MQHSICAIVLALALAVVNAAPYGGSGSYSAHHHAPAPIYSKDALIIPQEPSVLYNIPAPSHWNLAPAPVGPVLTPVNAHHISGSGKPSSLVGISSKPSAIAAAASANVPLNAGSYKLLIVPSYEVPNIVGPEPALPVHHPSAGVHGGKSASY